MSEKKKKIKVIIGSDTTKEQAEAAIAKLEGDVEVEIIDVPHGHGAGLESIWDMGHVSMDHKLEAIHPADLTFFDPVERKDPEKSRRKARSKIMGLINMALAMSAGGPIGMGGTEFYWPDERPITPEMLLDEPTKPHHNPKKLSKKERKKRNKK